MTKTCSKCGQTKPTADFHKKASNVGGLSARCKPCVLEKNRKWQQANAEVSKLQQRQYFKTYYQKRKLHRAATARAWVAANPEKHRAKAQRRRTALRQGGVFLVSDKFMLRLYKSPCIYCGATERIEADHVMPIARGGTHSIGNLAPACMSCNRSKRDQTITEWRKAQKEAA